jgi:hypothetical protein
VISGATTEMQDGYLAQQRKLRVGYMGFSQVVLGIVHDTCMKFKKHFTRMQVTKLRKQM